MVNGFLLIDNDVATYEGYFLETKVALFFGNDAIFLKWHYFYEMSIFFDVAIFISFCPFVS